MKGGGPQGSTNGVISYMSQSNSNADSVPLEDRYKYFDDLTVVEIVNLVNIGISTARVRDTVPSDLPQHNQLVNNNHLKSQEYLDSINQWTEDNLMMLNAKKTKSMQFNFSKNLQFKTDLVLKQQKIENVQEIKLLGVILTSDLRWDRNIDYLVKDANKRMVMLHAASKFTSDKQVLKQIYFSRIRCKLDQSAVVWNSSLTLKNISDLERVQRSAIRIIYGKKYESYSGTLKELSIQSLSERREMLCLKFAKKSLKVDNFKHLFPISKNQHDMRTRSNNMFKVNSAFSARYLKSAIPAMQKILNRDRKQQQQALKSLMSPTNYASNGLYC